MSEESRSITPDSPDLATENTNLRSTIISLGLRLAQLDRENTDLSIENVSLRARNEENVSLRARNEDLTDFLNEVNNGLAQATANRDTLIAELDTAIAERDTANKARDAANAREEAFIELARSGPPTRQEQQPKYQGWTFLERLDLLKEKYISELVKKNEELVQTVNALLQPSPPEKSGPKEVEHFLNF